MIEVVVVLDYNPQKVPQEMFAQLCEKAYSPLLNMCDELMLPTVHAISGRVIERLHTQRQEEIIQALKNMVSKEQGIIATKGFSSAAFTQLSKTEILHQLGFAHEVNKETFGKSTNIFMPQEGWIDVYMPGILKKAGFKCALLSGNCVVDFYKKAPESTSTIHKMRGLKNSHIHIISSYTNGLVGSAEKINELFTGKITAKDFTNELFLLFEKVEKPILMLHVNAETPFFQEGPRSAIQRLRFFIEGLQGTGNFHFCLPLPLIERAENEAELGPALIQDKRLRQLATQARDLIMEKEKKDPEALAIRKAWKSLLFAHDYCFTDEYLSQLDSSDKMQYQNVSDLYIQACERAQLAIKNALEA